QPLQPSQTLGRVVPCNNFQDARSFLGDSTDGDETTLGQRGRQRAILREGVYAINLALFVIITEDVVYRLDMQGQHELQTLVGWQRELRPRDAFSRVVVGAWPRFPAAEADEAEAKAAAPRRVRGKVVGVPIPEVPEPVEPQAPTGVDNIAIITVHDGPSLAA